MKKKIFVLFFAFIVGVLGLACSGNVLYTNAEEIEDSFIIRSYGDSIASGEKLEGHGSYTSGESLICQDSYPEVFSRDYLQYFGGMAIGHAVSGDKTGDLLEILNPYIEGTAEDMDAFNDTDIVTLCIGANNILLPAIDSIPNFITNNMTEEEYQTILDEGIAQFEVDYPQILDAFAGKNVVVMTVYNPYKYLSLNDITIDPSLSFFEETIRGVLASYETKLQKMLSMSMDALQTINEKIRESASSDVHVVDIWELFSKFTKEEYLKYINADMSNVVINSKNMSNITSGDLAPLMNDLRTNCDPHPSKEGHEVIGQHHLDRFKYFELSTSVDFSVLKDGNEKVQMEITTFESEEYCYKLYKKEESEELVCQSTEKIIEINASEIEGEGILFVEVYKEESLIFTTNIIDFYVNLNEFSISTDDMFSGVKDIGQQMTIKFDATEKEGYAFKFIKYQNGIQTVLSEEALDEYIVKAEDIEGLGKLYVEVYKNETLVTTTNAVVYDITINTFSISMDKNWNDVLLDATDSAEISINANDYSNYSYQLYKSDENGETLLIESSDIILSINSLLVEGEGTLFLDVYKDGKKLYTTESIKYKVTINRFAVSSLKELEGLVKKEEIFDFSITAQSTEGYLYKMFHKMGESATLIKEGEQTLISLGAEDIDGEGEIYVEVYKDQTKVYTTESLTCNIIVANFALASMTDFQTINDVNQEVLIVVNSGVIPNVEFKLMCQTEDKTTSIETNRTGRFSFKAGKLTEAGKLYVEIYYNKALVTTTNQLEYNITFVNKENTESDNNNSGVILIYSCIAVVGVLVVAGVVLLITRMKKRNPF